MDLGVYRVACPECGRETDGFRLAEDTVQIVCCHCGGTYTIAWWWLQSLLGILEADG